MRARWRGKEAEISTRAALLELAANIEASGEPTLLSLEASNGVTLYVGLGSSETILLFHEDPDEPFHSLGDVEREDRLLFQGWSQLDEFFGELALPGDIALPALLSFWESGGKRPDGICWESDDS